MAEITVIIFTYNEERQIQECIESAHLLTNHILVVDTESSDNTVTRAKQGGAKVISFPHVSYVEPVRGFGIKQAKTKWVFILDGDERITPELAQEIKSEVNNSDRGFFKVPRKNIFGRNKWLKYGGWWPDHQTRLINTEKFVSWPKEIHSTPNIKGGYALLDRSLIHYFHGDIENMVNKTTLFEGIESDLLYNAKTKVSTLVFFRKFFGELWRRMFRRLGFLDGEVGIIENIYQAFSKTITYLFLYEKKR